ncbi:MAG TPA: uroporphyrinogen-III synthase [Flavobacterium sp.]|nr:uroporphyrinogen-III synthase [Flavobacterium sp.]
MITILSTKKLQINQKQILLDAGFSVVEADFIAIQQKEIAFYKINQNLIFTSQHSVLSLMSNSNFTEHAAWLKQKNVFCVGIKTKELLESSGFNVIAYTDYAADLAKIITLLYGKEKFTFFSGNLRRDTLPHALQNASVDFNEMEIYDTLITPHKIQGSFNGILFFSPSGVESYLKHNKISRETCFCIGTTTAEALQEITDKIILADQPTVENVIIQCVSHYK